MSTATPGTATSAKETAALNREPGAEGESLIDRDSHFNGLYETKQNLRIEGLAEGEIQCQGTLLVAEGARVKARVTASTVTIAGELDGEVVCRGVFQILPTGQVQASVSAHRLIVQEGGLYNGNFRMISDETPLSFPEMQPHSRLSPASEDESEIGSDEWWKKFEKEEPAANDNGTEERLEESS